MSGGLHCPPPSPPDLPQRCLQAVVVGALLELKGSSKLMILPDVKSECAS